jgi:hypothetical protein
MGEQKKQNIPIGVPRESLMNRFVLKNKKGRKEYKGVRFLLYPFDFFRKYGQVAGNNCVRAVGL